MRGGLFIALECQILTVDSVRSVICLNVGKNSMYLYGICTLLVKNA